MIVIPAIDLKNGLCVRLLQGRKSELTVYNEDPIAVARAFAAAGAEMIHVVDLDGAFNEVESPNRAVVRRIIEAVDVPIEFGGGVRSLDDVQQLCDAGVAHVVLGTVAAEAPGKVKDFVNRFGSKICVGIDARDGRVLVRGWETSTELKATDLAKKVAAAGIERIIYTDTVRDGMLTGPNIKQTIAIAHASQLKVTASGGISSLDDIKSLREANEPLLDIVIGGKALYEKRFSLEDALQLCEQ